MNQLIIDRLTQFILESSRSQCELGSVSSNLSQEDEEDLVKYVLGLPKEVKSYDLADTVLAMSLLARHPKVSYHPGDLAIVREIGYRWHTQTGIRDNRSPETAIFLDAYARLKELTHEMKLAFNKVDALECTVHAEDYARQEVLNRLLREGERT